MRRSRALPRFLLATDAQRCPDPLPLVSALPGDAGVIYRHYGHPGRDALAREVAALCRRRGLPLLIANDLSLALRVRAQGVHLPQWRLRRGEAPGRPSALRRPHEGFRVTVSVHSLACLARAARLPVDGVLLSPAFATASHPQGKPIGAMRFASWSRRYGRQVAIYALGGMDGPARRRLQHCLLAGTAATRWR